MTDDLDLDTAIAVTGMACRFPGAPDVDAYWRNLCAEVEAIQRFDLAELTDAGAGHPAFVPACAPVPDPYAFDDVHFRVPPASARALDPQQRVFVECAWTALEGAGALAPERAAVAVFAGCSDTTYQSAQRRDGGQGGSLALDISTSSDYLATRTAFLLGLRGPAVTVRTACSTSLVAIHLAVQSLLMNECDFAMAGGAAIRHPLRRGHVWEPGGIYSSDGRCRPYDQHASGIVSGDGVGAVVLRRLDDAVEDGDYVHAVIRGSAINNDGSAKAGFTAPSVEGQVEVALTALEVAGLDPAAIGFVEGHGTATPLGDPIEVEALSRVWGSGRASRCMLGSVKSGIGHLDAAAGVASFIKACLAVEHGRIPGTLNYTAPNPHSSLAESAFAVSAETIDWHEDDPRRASVHSLGLGGTNAHVIIEQAPVRDAEVVAPIEIPVVLPLSTRRSETLDGYANALAGTLERTEVDVAAVARTLQDGRVAEAHRRVAVGSDRAQLARALRSAAAPSRPADHPRVVLAFPGDGKRVRGALRELSQHLPPVSEVLRESAAHLKSRWGVDLAAIGVESSTRGVLPAIVAQGLAIHAGLEAFGVGGDVVLGLSLGELTAAAASGLISRTEVLDLAMSREMAFRAVAPSGALAIGVAPDALAGRLPRDVEVSIVTAPNRCVVSGPVDVLARFANEIAADGTPVHRLDVISAVHCSLLDSVLDDFRRAAELLTPQRPVRTMLSTVGPTEVDERLAADPDHWARQLREPIRFDSGVRAAVAGHGHAVVVDVGPFGGLGTAIRETVGEQARAVVSLSRPNEDVSELEAFGSALGQLWEAGVPVDWSAWPRRASRRAVLPVPPLVRTVHGPDVPIDRQPNAAKSTRVALWNRGWRRDHQTVVGEGAQRIAVLTGADPLGGAAAERLADRGHHVEASTDVGRAGEHDLVIDARAVGASDGPAAVSEFLEAAARASETRLVVLTRGAFDVLGTETMSPAAAAVAAAALVAAQEQDHSSMFCLDVEETADIDVMARTLLSTPSGALLGQRGRSLWSPVVDEVDRPGAALPNVRPGVYVITGGLGRFGRWVGRWLAEHACRDLILIGRSGLDGPEPDLRADAVTAMRTAGARVAIVQADVTDHAAITRALDDARQVGEMTILHLAGEPNAVSAGAPIGDLVKTGLRQALDEQWAAKVGGAEVLLDWIRRHPETRCVTFSSNAAVLGGPGLAAYAAANAALDSLAVRAGDREGLNWCSIGWDGWRLPEDPDPKTPSALNEFALRGHEPWQALRTAIAADRWHVVVAKGDLAARHHTWVESPNPAPQPVEVQSPVDDADDAVSTVRGIWAEVLGRPAPHDDADLFKEGGDSLVAMRIRSRLELEFDGDISLQQVIENRTVAGLSALVRKGASDQSVSATNETVRGRI